MKPKYILVPANHALAGQRRKVRCKCTEGINGLQYEVKHEKIVHFFHAGKYGGNCPVCKYGYFYVE